MMKSERLRGLAGSVVVHLVVLAILVLTLWQDPEPPKAVSHKPVIQARAVDEATAMAAVRAREAEEQRARDALRRKEELKRQAAEAEKKQQAAEQKKKVEAEKRREAEAKQKKLEQEKKQQAIAQQKRLEQEKLQQAEQRKKEEAEQLRLKDEAERKKKEAEDRARREKELKERMAREAAAERAQYNQQLARDRDRYIAAIEGAIQQNWQRPPGSPTAFVCKVLVKQIPSGDVIDVRVSESCGNMMLNLSVESAVRKASPLPLPANRDLFDRELEITFVPK